MSGGDWLGRLVAALAGAAAMWIACAVSVSAYDTRRPMPALIAHDCDGAGGDLWAMDESDFPTMCGAIERY